MSDSFDWVHSCVVPRLHYSWLILSLVLIMLFYNIFSVTNWFAQVGSGVLISLGVVALYVLVMVRLDNM